MPGSASQRELVETNFPGETGPPSSLYTGSAHEAFTVSKANVILEQLSGKGCSNLAQYQTFQISSLFFIKTFHGCLWVKLHIFFGMEDECCYSLERAEIRRGISHFLA